VVLGVALALLILWLGRRAEGDRLAMTAAVGAALLLSPIVWVHYYVLLLVPVALARPRLAGLWFVPLFFWSTHTLESNGELWRLFTALALTIAVTTLSLRRMHRDAVASVAAVTPGKRNDGPIPAAGPSTASLAG